MELQIVEQKTIQALPVQLQEFVAAKIGKPSIKDLKPYELEDGIQDILTRCYAEMGQTAAGTDEVMIFLRTTLIEDLTGARFKHLTLEEIKLFISKGIRGDYPSFNGQLNSINIRNIHHWIKQGLASKEREIAMKEFNKQLEEIEKRSDIPVHLKIQRSKDGCLRAFKEYKETKQLPFFPYKYYDMIKEFTGVKSLCTVEQYKEIKNKTEAELTNEIMKFKVKYEAKGNLRDAELLGERLANLDKDQGLIAKQKTLMLKAFFDSLIYQGKELELK